MYRLTQPLVDLYALTGEAIDGTWISALADIHVPGDVSRRQAERLACIAHGRKPDRIPFCADLNWWFAERYHDGTLHEDIRGIDLGKVFGGPPRSYSSLWKPEPLPGVVEEVVWSGDQVSYVCGRGYPGTRRTVRLHTPLGTLTAAEEYASRSFGIIEYPVKTIDDLRIASWLYEQSAVHAKPPTADRGLPCAPLTPLQNLIVHLAGVENAVFLLTDARAAAEAAMECMEEVSRPVIKFLAKHQKSVFSVENITSEVSAGYWNAYLGPQLARRSAIAQGEHAIHGIHLDGTLVPLLSYMTEAGVDYVNGITAAPSGDLEPELIRKAAGPQLILYDILPQVIFTPVFNEADFEAYVRRAINFYRNDCRVVFGIGDMLPYNGCLHRVERVVVLLEEILS